MNAALHYPFSLTLVDMECLTLLTCDLACALGKLPPGLK